jgi:hypothetical protein
LNEICEQSSICGFVNPMVVAEDVRLPKKLDLQRTCLAKSVVMLAFMSFFHPHLKFSTGESLDHSVDPRLQRTHFVANHVAPFPSMNRENQPLVTNEPVTLEKQVVVFKRITGRLRKIPRRYLKFIKNINMETG